MRYTAATIAEMLAQRAEDVCQRLLPSGKRVGAEWAAGDVHGGAGGSLKVRLTGAKAGVWCDFADEGAKGDLLDLWRLSQNVTTGEAISQAKAWMGVSEPRSSDIKPIYDRNRPAPQTEGIKRLSEGSPVFRYLTEERFIEPDTLAAYRIGEFQRNGDPAIVFPIFDPVKAAGKATALKYLALGRKPDGKKITWSSKGSVWHAFGWSAIPESSRLIVLTEGEIDAMTIHSWGVPAISIPQGAENDGWIGEDFDHLERFDEIYLCLDNDEAGLKATDRLSK